MRRLQIRGVPADYSFRTRWTVAAPPAACWAAIERLVTGDGSNTAAGEWWRALRIERPAAALARGARFAMSVRAPFGYRLRATLRITELEAGRTATAQSTGDLAGHGRIEVAPQGSGSAIRIAWDVTVGRRWMRVTGPVLRPAFVLAHWWVMRAGERGIRRALAASGGRKTANRAPG